MLYQLGLYRRKMNTLEFESVFTLLNIPVNVTFKWNGYVYTPLYI